MTTSTATASALSKARNSIAPDSFTELIGLIRLKPGVAARLFHKAYPHSFAQLKREVTILDPINLGAELLWARSYLIKYGNRLSEFRKLADQFERALLQSKFDLGREILADIESQFGVSLWLLKRKIPFLQTADGDSGRKSYVEAVLMTAPEQGIASYITYYVDYRNETTVTPDRFRAVFRDHIKSLELEKDLETYLSYHIDPDLFVNRRGLVDILRWEYSGSVIDYYETFITVCRMAVNANYADSFDSMITSISGIHARTEDPRLAMLLCELEPDFMPSAVQPASDKANGAFLRGDFSEALNGALIAMRDTPENSDLLEIAARSLSSLNQESVKDLTLCGLLIDALAKSYSLETVPEESRSALLRYGANYFGQHLADRIVALLRFQQDRELPRAYSFHFSSAAAPFVSSTRVRDFPNNDFREKYMRVIGNVHGETLSVKYGQAIAGCGLTAGLLEELSSEERALLQAQLAWDHEEYETAISWGRLLLVSEFGYYKKAGITIVADGMLSLGSFSDCINFVTSCYLEFHQHELLPIERLVSEIETAHDKPWVKEISTPILYDLYSNHIGSDYDLERRYAYEDFVVANGIQRPSELRTFADNFDRQELIYFLRFIATEQVMDVSTVFDGSKDIAEERIAVCRFLAEIDEDNSSIYMTEIKEILRRLMIQKRVREVQLSKIYVDVDSIRRTDDKILRSSFQRYKALLTASATEDGRSLRKERKDKVAQLDLEGLLRLPLPSNEVADVFSSMITRLRDQFVSSNEHGLDGYLSVRIRHGTLQGQLRSPLENAGLLVQRNSITGGYNIDPEFLSTLNVSDNVAARVGELLEKFTGQFDQLVNRIINQWIQIKKTPSDSGLFDFTLTKLHANVIEAQLTEDTTLDEFVELIFKLFFETLEYHLTTVRRAVGIDAKNVAMELLTQLQMDLEVCSQVADIGELIRDIKAAQTDLQRVFDRVTEWFRLSQTTAGEPLLIEDAIQISVETVKTFTRGISVNVENLSNMPILVIGRLLTGFVDILSIIFENVLRHSGIYQPEAIITIARANAAIELTVRNVIGDSVDSQENRQRLADIQARIQDQTYGQSVSKEGGTGFIKIWKILNHDFKEPQSSEHPDLEFGFGNDGTFYVKFSLLIEESHEGADY